MLDDGARPPAQDASWSSIALPDLWSDSRPSSEGSGWYRFSFEHLADGALGYAVYLPKVNMNAAVFVNGHWIGDGGSFEPPVSQNWNRPLYFPFPAELLEASGNVVHVRIYAYAHDWGGLHPLYVGPHTQLVERAEVQQAWQVTTSQVASVIVLLLAIAIGAMAVGREEPVYRYWAAGCLLYFVHSLSPHVRDIVVPYTFGRWLIHASFDVFALLLVLGIHRWADVDRPRLERAFVVIVGGGALVTLVLPSALFLTVANVLHLAPITLGAYGSWVMVGRFRQLGGPEAALTVIAGAVIITLGVHALLIYFGVLPQDEPRLLKLMAPVLMVAFGGVLVARYVRAANEAEALNEELVARVADKEAALLTQFERSRRLESEQVLAGERSRLMQEMHDGMGGRLVSLLAMVEGGAPSRELMSSTLVGALQEMRFIIDSLDPDIDDVGALLGVVRERVEPRLRSHGPRFVWRVIELPEDFKLGPEQSLDLLRIVEEALTNVLKHAGADVIELGTRVKGDRAGRELVIHIADDGGGFDVQSASGRGLENLRRRAERLGGRIDVTSGDEGTRVEVTLPCPYLSSSIRPSWTAS